MQHLKVFIKQKCINCKKERAANTICAFKEYIRALRRMLKIEGLPNYRLRYINYHIHAPLTKSFNHLGNCFMSTIAVNFIILQSWRVSFRRKHSLNMYFIFSSKGFQRRRQLVIVLRRHCLRLFWMEFIYGLLACDRDTRVGRLNPPQNVENRATKT